MSLENLLSDRVSKWMEGDGPASEVVLSSRIRLARNLQGYPYPTQMNEQEAERLLHQLQEILPELRRRNSGEPLGDLRFSKLSDLTGLERQVLVDYHLISPQHARSQAGTAVLVNKQQSISIMVNEEDHLRIQCLLPGFQLETAWKLADQVDDALEQHLDLSFDEELGYLTTCPTNTGTGLRASVMMHLPGLVRSKQVHGVVSALAKVGMVVRGMYGEGSEPIGNVFQISNQLTLGQSEKDILRNLIGVCQQLIERERSLREKLYQERRLQIEDQVSRAYGILTHARVISSDEAITLLSHMRLGIDLNILSHIDKDVFNELIVTTRPAYLQYQAGQELSAAERDVRRATQIRQTLARAVKRFNDTKEA